MPSRVAIVLTARPSYAKLVTVLEALTQRAVDVQLVVCASALLERYGRVVDVVRRDWPTVPIHEVYSTVEGSTLLTSALESGSLCSQLGLVFASLNPTLVCLVADRHEVLAAAMAARFLEIPILHLQGGEASGSVDDTVRHAVTNLASVHCVCTTLAACRVWNQTGSAQIHVTGCPSIDVAHLAMTEPAVTHEELGGSGAPVDLARPFVVVLQHPVTETMAEAGPQMAETLQALHGRQAVVLWPGQDAGADAMSKAIRCGPPVHTVRSLPPRRFLRLLRQSACLVGNSSAGIREGSFLGVPVVNIGTRQRGREHAENVRTVGHSASAIHRAIDAQIAHGPYPSRALYGQGDAGQRIAEVIEASL